MKVSVVIPVYNVEQYLGACLDSILTQTYKNIEVILVDDGSVDGSPTLCHKYAKKDSRVIFLQQTNRGVSAARNAGIDASTGNFLMFVDSDDLLVLNAIEVLVRNIRVSRADIATCALRHFRDHDVPHVDESDAGHTVIGKDEALKELLYQKNIIAGSVCKLFRKKIFTSLRFQEGVKVAEDLDVTYRAIVASDTVAISCFIGYYYRLHANSAMQKRFNKDRMHGLTICKSILMDSRKYSEAIIRASENRLFMEAIYVTLLLPLFSRRYHSDIDEVWTIVKRHRRAVLLDRQNGLKASKVYAAVSYLGWILYKIISLGRSYVVRQFRRHYV